MLTILIKKNLNIFRKIKKFNNFYLKLQKIDSKYDLIILSHSIFHITRLHESFDTISKLLKKDSHILIITPDPYKYLFYLMFLRLVGFQVKKIL